MFELSPHRQRAVNTKNGKLITPHSGDDVTASLRLVSWPGLPAELRCLLRPWPSVSFAILRVIQINNHDRSRVAVPLAALFFAVEQVIPAPSVVKPREGIPHGLCLQAFCVANLFCSGQFSACKILAQQLSQQFYLKADAAECLQIADGDQ